MTHKHVIESVVNKCGSGQPFCQTFPPQLLILDEPDWGHTNKHAILQQLKVMPIYLAGHI